MKARHSRTAVPIDTKQETGGTFPEGACSFTSLAHQRRSSVWGKKPRAFKTARRQMCNLRNPSATQGFVFGVFSSGMATLIFHDPPTLPLPLCRCRVSTLQQEGLEFNFFFHWHTSQTGRARRFPKTCPQREESQPRRDQSYL